MGIAKETNINAKDLLNRSVVLYGPSGSGKTYTIRHMLKELDPYITQIFVFCPTNPQNKAYTNDDFIPAPMVHDTFDIKTLKEIFERNSALSSIVNAANEYDNLKRLFSYLNINTSVFRQIEATFEEKKRRLRDMYLDKDKIQEEILKMNEIYKSHCKNIYKAYLRRFKSRIDPKSLSSQDLQTYEYFDVNPAMAVVIDDCSSELQALNKEDTTILKMFFTKNRHPQITTIVSVHGDKNVPFDIRTNAFYSIFTKPSIANNFFSYPQNGFDKATRLKAREVISKYLIDKQKIMYERESQEFYYYTAKSFPSLKIGHPILREYSNRIGGTDQPLVNNNNKYSQCFAVRKR